MVTWGSPRHGGDGTAVRSQLKQTAFAAVRVDGLVVTWGSASHGGDSSGVQDQLMQVQASHCAFAAILANGSAVHWGAFGLGQMVREQLQNVREVQANGSAFAFILADGSVMSWGDAVTAALSTTSSRTCRRSERFCFCSHPAKWGCGFLGTLHWQS